MWGGGGQVVGAQWVTGARMGMPAIYPTALVRSPVVLVGTAPRTAVIPRGPRASAADPPKPLVGAEDVGEKLALCDERRAVVAELGEPAFRADQLARHYFTRLSTDPAAMTDLPAARRDRLVAALLPEPPTPVRHTCGESGATRKTRWWAAGGRWVLPPLRALPRGSVPSPGRCPHACSTRSPG